MTIEPFWVQSRRRPALRQGDLLPRCLVPIPGLDSTTDDGKGRPSNTTWLC